MTRFRPTLLAPLLLLTLAAAAPVRAETAAPGPQQAGPHDTAPTSARDAPPQGPHGTLKLSAISSSDGSFFRAGLQWRVFDDTGAPDAGHRLIAQSNDPQPAFVLPDGHYIVHAAAGYASAMKRVAVAGSLSSDQVTLAVGAIEVRGLLGDTPIPPDKLVFSIFVPEHNNPEAKLVVTGAKPGQVIRLPEGDYHVVSTYLDTTGVGSLTPVTNTNSVVSADLRVQAGKVVQATLRHRAAMLILKLVNAPGGEALANTSFTILTPGGDVIRELIGAFPSLILAEGDYVAIARHDAKTFQAEFKVQSGTDRDVEVVAK